MSIGENIKALRANRNMSQAELSEAINVSQSMLCQIERGTKVPSLPLSKEISDALGCHIEDLLGLEISQAANQ